MTTLANPQQEQSGLFEQLRQLIAKHLELDLSDVQKDSHLIDDLGASSIKIVVMVTSMERQFGITVPDHVLPSLRTVEDISAFLEAMQQRAHEEAGLTS